MRNACAHKSPLARRHVSAIIFSLHRCTCSDRCKESRERGRGATSGAALQGMSTTSATAEPGNEGMLGEQGEKEAIGIGLLTRRGVAKVRERIVGQGGCARQGRYKQGSESPCSRHSLP